MNWRLAEMAQQNHSRGRSGPTHRKNPLAQQAPLVSARWLLWSLTIVFGGGLALVYLTSCLLFWQGQWQILFHPIHEAKQVPPNVDLPLEDVRFATTEAGQPRLDGWFIPAASGGRYQGQTILYLHSMSAGSLNDIVPELTALHKLEINVFAFDYRGFGKSVPLRPTEELATEDTNAAWDYLISTRHIPAGSIVFYGKGLGASLAAEAAARHPQAGAVVLDTPSATALELIRADSRSRWMPLWLLVHDRFDPRSTLESLKTPKLFLLSTDAKTTGAKTDYAKLIADPKIVVYLPINNAAAAKQEAMQRLLDELTAPR